jgi:hypothetical protein
MVGAGAARLSVGTISFVLENLGVFIFSFFKALIGKGRWVHGLNWTFVWDL